MLFRVASLDDELKDRAYIAGRYGETVLFRLDDLAETVPEFHLTDAHVDNDPYETVEMLSVHAVRFGKPCAQCWPAGGAA